jgi:hypothetical protein
MRRKTALTALLLASAVALTATAAMGATTITGSIYFNGGFASNGYNPTNGGVPAGYGNETSNTVIVGSNSEFGFQDDYNRDTADFTNTTLTLEDQVLSVGASSWQQTFTASTPDFFQGLTLASSTFSSLTYSVSGDTLTVNWPGEYGTVPADFTATFDFTGAPEPEDWILMISGLGIAGLMLRHARRRRRWETLAAAS